MKIKSPTTIKLKIWIANSFLILRLGMPSIVTPLKSAIKMKKNAYIWKISIKFNFHT